MAINTGSRLAICVVAYRAKNIIVANGNWIGGGGSFGNREPCSV
jgi:hypothetical protein